MPQAPELVPSVAPTTQGVGEVNLPVPVDAFGGAVGHALQGLGSEVEKGSDRIWQRAVEIQNLNNETEAKDADAKYMMQAGMLHADFSALEGNAAKAAFPKYMEDLQNLRTSLRSGLSNPMAQRMYDASSLSVMGRTIFNGAGHAAQQNKVAASNASQARVDQMSDGIGANPTDELTYQRYTRGIAAETRQQGEIHGWSPEQTDETVKQNISTAIAKRIIGLARTDAIGAQAMFDRASKSGDLLPVMADRVQATVQTQFRQQGSRIISDKVLAGRRSGDEDDKTEDQYIADGVSAAQEIAKKTGINDPLFADFVRERVSADYRRQKSIERDNQQDAEQTVAAAMMTGNKEGILPKSVDELRLIDPKVGAAWDSLKPTTQRRYMQAFKQNAQGDRMAWTNDSLRTYQQIKGQAADDPVSFLARDIVGESIPSSGKRELINLQQRLRSQSQSDPRVARALSILTPDLRAAGIDKTSDKDGYFQFVGALQDQLDQFQADHKKVPSLEEVRTIGAQLMQEQATGRRGWLIFNDEKTPTYQLPLPEEEKERLSRDPYWAAHNIKPNDDMLARIYRAQKFRELYGGSAKKIDKGASNVSFPPNAPSANE